MFGVFVAYVKLGDLVHITLGVGVYALFALTFLMIWADSCAGPPGGMGARSTVPVAERRPPALGAWVAQAHRLRGLRTGQRHRARMTRGCPRCDAPLHRRKPDSVRVPGRS